MKLQKSLEFLLLFAVSASACQPAQTMQPSAIPEIIPESSASAVAETAVLNECDSATDPDANSCFSFDKIIPCLNTPDKMTSFHQNNMVWDPEWDFKEFDHNAYLPASEVYLNGVDDCDGMAEFIACVFSQNSYEAYNVGISITGMWGFNAGGFVGKDGMKYGYSDSTEPDGPFSTWEELAQHYIDLGYAEPDGVIWLFSPCIDSLKEGKEVLNLSHVIVR